MMQPQVFMHLISLFAQNISSYNILCREILFHFYNIQFHYYDIGESIFNKAMPRFSLPLN